MSKNEQYLIQKFLARTLLYNKLMRKEVKHLGFTRIDVASILTAEELLKFIGI